MSAARRGVNTIGLSGDPLTLSTVYACVNVIANTIGSLPLLYQRQVEGIYRAAGGGLQYLLQTEPNDYVTGIDLRSGIARDLLLWGNSYVLPRRDDSGDIVALYRCSPGSVCYDSINDVYTITDEVQHISGTFAAYEVCHFRGLSLDGKRGVSVLEHARRSTEIGSAAVDETYKRFKSGGTIRGILGNTEIRSSFASNSPREVRDYAQDMEDMLDEDRRILPMPHEVAFHQLTMSAADMQFLESRKFEVREICRFFGVHPSLVFDDSSSNYKSAEMARSDFMTFTLNPLLMKIETELTRKLVPVGARTGRERIVFDRSAINAFNIEAQMSERKLRLESGMSTVNELRRECDMPPVADGDVVLVSANLKALGEMSQGYNQTNKK